MAEYVGVPHLLCLFSPSVERQTVNLYSVVRFHEEALWSHSLMVVTTGFHPVDRGSIPLGIICRHSSMVERHTCKVRAIGSSPIVGFKGQRRTRKFGGSVIMALIPCARFDLITQLEEYVAFNHGVGSSSLSGVT